MQPLTHGRVRDWEQGRSNIDAPSRILLMFEKEPEAVQRAFSQPKMRGYDNRLKMRRQAEPHLIIRFGASYRFGERAILQRSV